MPSLADVDLFTAIIFIAMLVCIVIAGAAMAHFSKR